MTRWPRRIRISLSEIPMGVWGFGPFENDDAMDFVRELEDSQDAEILCVTFGKVTEENDYLEIREAARAVVAAEVVAAVRGSESSEIPDELWNYIRNQNEFDRETADEAIRCVKRIMRDSEMMALWDGTKDGAGWKRHMDDLISRL